MTRVCGPTRRREIPRREPLSGTVARRVPTADALIWDEDLPGFGLRQYATGRRTWIVQFRVRGAVRRIGLGDATRVTAQAARAAARDHLRRAKLDGLPVRPTASSAVPLRFAAYVDEFWRDYAPHWKPSTQRRSRSAIGHALVPFFGTKPLPAIDRQDVLAFRESRARCPGGFHIELAVLSAMLGYAEKLGYRTKGTNPCVGIPRFKRPLKERFLAAREYQRLATVLRGREAEMPRSIAIVWLLLFTGARRSEIEGLQWEWMTPAYVRLPDSKSGAKRLYLNRAAAAVLARLGRLAHGRVFSAASRSKLSQDWEVIRRAAAIPDVRLHDLRHSFASVAITDGMPLLTLGRLLGHVLPETTARYAHLADHAVQDAAARVSGSIASALGVRS